MDEEKHKELIGRLKTEGQLTRNTGTNSIKSLRVDFSKFGEVFSSINRQLEVQGNTLLDILDVQSKMAKLQVSEQERSKRKDQLESVSKTVSGDSRVAVQDVADGPRTFGSSASLLSGFFQRIGPGLGGFIGASLGGLSMMLNPMMLGGMLIRAIPLITLAPFIGQFVSSFITQSLEDLNVSPELTEAARNPLTRAGMWGAMGLIFGPKGAFVGFMAGLFSGFGEKVLESLGITGDEVTDQQWNVLGINFSTLGATETILAGLGGTLALLAPKLLSLTSKLLMGALVGPLGIAAITGVALVGTVALLNNWLEKRRDDFIEELEERTREGFASLEDVAQEENIPFLRRLGLSLGMVDPQSRTEELDVLRRTVDAASELTGMGDFGDPGSRAVLDRERRESLQRSVEQIVGAQPLESLSNRNLLDLKSIAEQLQMTDLLRDIDAAIERNETLRTMSRAEQQLSALMRERDMFVQEFGEPQGSRHLELLDSAIEESRRMLNEMSEELSFGAVPRQSTASLLGKMINEKFEPTFTTDPNRMAPVLDEISSAAHNVVNNIVYAPMNLSPVTSVNQGGSSVSSVTNNSLMSLGNGGGSGLGRFAN